MPVPEFFVAYNGKADIRNQHSEFYVTSNTVKIDIRAKIVDIHYDRLQERDKNNALAGYAFFYKAYDMNCQRGFSKTEAFDTARSECMRNGYLLGYIDREEFIGMYKFIFDYDMQLRAEGREEGIEKGIEKGEEKGREEMLLVSIKNNFPPDMLEVMRSEAGISEERFEELAKEARG